MVSSLRISNTSLPYFLFEPRIFSNRQVRPTDGLTRLTGAQTRLLDGARLAQNPGERGEARGQRDVKSQGLTPKLQTFQEKTAARRADLFKPNKMRPIDFDVLQDFLKQASSDILAFVDGDYRGSPVGMAEIGMTAFLTNFVKSQLVKNADNLNGFERSQPAQTATLISWSPTNLRGLGASFWALRQSLIASWMRLNSSGMLFAWVWQPLRAGTEPTSIPSSSSSINNTNSADFMILPSFDSKNNTPSIPSQALANHYFLRVVVRVKDDKIEKVVTAYPVKTMPVEGVQKI
jgi:hypothetical protein